MIARPDEPRTKPRRRVHVLRLVNTAEIVLASECTLRPALRLVALALAANGYRLPSTADLSKATGFPEASIPRIVADLARWNGPPPEAKR